VGVRWTLTTAGLRVAADHEVQRRREGALAPQLVRYDQHDRRQRADEVRETLHEDGRDRLRSAGANQLRPSDLQLDVVLVGTTTSFEGDALGDLLGELHGRGREHRPDAVHARQNAFGCDGGICGRYEKREVRSDAARLQLRSPRVTWAHLLPGTAARTASPRCTRTSLGEHFDVTPAQRARRLSKRPRPRRSTNTNPKGNGARTVALNFFPPPEFGRRPGDYVQLIVTRSGGPRGSRTRR